MERTWRLGRTMFVGTSLIVGIHQAKYNPIFTKYSHVVTILGHCSRSRSAAYLLDIEQHRGLLVLESHTCSCVSDSRRRAIRIMGLSICPLSPPANFPTSCILFSCYKGSILLQSR